MQTRTPRFVIINDGPWGTVCARVGCMPSKALIASAAAFHARGSLDEFGIRGARRLSIDVRSVLQRVRALRDAFVKSNLPATQDLGPRAISGRAQLLGPDCVRVNGKELRARKIIIATGSSPIVPPEWRALGPRVLTTDTLFEQKTLPRRIAVVGQGPLGVELAQALSRLALKVVAFDTLPTVGGLTDPEVNRLAIRWLKAELPIHLGHEATLHARAQSLQVRAGRAVATVDSVLVALGRSPNIEGLGLETLGVKLDEKGLPNVDPRTMQVGRLPIFLAGDVESALPLLHEALDEGLIAGLNATKRRIERFSRRVPLTIVFTEPNIALVGEHFEDLDRPRIGEARFEDLGRARIADCARGVVRIYADRKTGRLLGAELCAPAAEHFAHLLALAIERRLTAAQVLRMPCYHPTFEEGLREALRQLTDSARADELRA